jgi:hypothetical protein
MQKQQGDVNIESCDSIPKDAKPLPLENGLYVIARGETTGHKHALEADGVEVYEKDGLMYVKVSREVQLKHEEHKPVTIPRGTFKMWGVREYDHAKEEARRVQD